MAKNPIEDFTEYKSKAAADRQTRALEYWERWKAAPEAEKPTHLQPLLQMYNPVFNRKVREWKPPGIPESAIRADMHRHFIDALGNYDPSRAALSTHVERRLQKSLRFVGKHQNVAYIPEGQTQHIGKIYKARDELNEQFGRPPTHDEIADHLGMQPKRVETVLKSLKRDIPASMFESDPTPQMSSREQEVLGLLGYALSPDEKTVFEHIYGQNGRNKVTETNQLATLLGKSPSQISRLKTSILKKYNQYK